MCNVSICMVVFDMARMCMVIMYGDMVYGVILVMGMMYIASVYNVGLVSDMMGIFSVDMVRVCRVNTHGTYV